MTKLVKRQNKFIKIYINYFLYYYLQTMFTLNRLLNELYKKKEWKRIEEIRTKFHIQIPVIDYKKVLASYNDFYFNINPVFYLHDRWKNSYNKDLLNTLIRIDLRNVE